MKKAARVPVETRPILEDTERRGGERSEAHRSGEASNIERELIPDPQVPTKATRRRFTSKFKLQVLREADRCKAPGKIGALLRRHGLYSSLLSTWRRERDAGALERLSQKRGRKPAPRNPLAAELAKVQRENRRLEAKLRKAELIIDIQKKASQILGIPLNTPESEDDE